MAESRDFDAVVIGAGVAGLVAAGLLARAGLRTLLVEQHTIPGGYCSTFRRGHYIFDAGVHVFGGCAPGGVLDRILCQLGVRDQIAFHDLQPAMYDVVVQGHRYPVPANLDALAQLLTDLDPADRQGIAAAIGEIREFGVALAEADQISGRLIELWPRYAGLSWHDFLRARLRSRRVIGLLSSMAQFGGLEPAALSATFMAGVLGSFHRGAFYPRGGSQRLPDVLLAGFRRWGGTALFRCRAEAILVARGAVRGVALRHRDQPLTVLAPVVVAAGDARLAAELAGPLPAQHRFTRNLRRLQPSVSCLRLFLALRPGPYQPRVHEFIHLPDWEFAVEYDPYAPEREPLISVCSPSAIDPGLARPGHHVCYLTVLASSDRAEAFREAQGKPALTAALLQMAERLCPGIGAQVEYLELATPRTFARYTWNHAGAIYGWAKGPDQTRPTDRLGPDTPIRGLYVAGHWAGISHGVYGSVKTARQTAERILYHWDGVRGA